MEQKKGTDRSKRKEIRECPCIDHNQLDDPLPFTVIIIHILKGSIYIDVYNFKRL